ncbi:hypothetical protein ACIBBE_42330 [Streptomyces sp. NPDC051644]|uniref:hypothetical protein n=1 Tax=Streptomyces sp. NPDC051644 TaxID=3365666 RepID=UPI0037B667AB
MWGRAAWAAGCCTTSGRSIEEEAGDLKATILEKLTSYLIPRNVFNDASDISGVATNLKAMAEKWIWGGNRPYPYEVHPECLDKNGEQITATRQQGNYTQIINKIETLIE